MEFGLKEVLPAVADIVESIGSVFCTIGSTVSGIAKELTDLAYTLIPSLAPTVEATLTVINATYKIVSAISETIWGKDPEEAPETLGIKAESSEKKPDSFHTTDEYIAYLQDKVPFNKESLENLSQEDKVKYITIGMAVYIKGIEEKYNVSAPGEFWRTAADRKLSGSEVHAYIEKFAGKGITDMKDMSDYLNGTAPESGTEKAVVSNAVIETMKSLNPALSDDQLAEKIESMIRSEG